MTKIIFWTIQITITYKITIFSKPTTTILIESKFNVADLPNILEYYTSSISSQLIKTHDIDDHWFHGQRFGNVIVYWN